MQSVPNLVPWLIFNVKVLGVRGGGGGRLLFEGAINRGTAIIRGNAVYKSAWINSSGRISSKISDFEVSILPAE